MATLIPETPKDCPYGERSVYEKLGRELDDEWIVLHSLGLTGHPNKIWGEADIVLLSTRGFFALEVKGGRVSCKDGVWHFGEPGSPGYSKREDPWTQAKGTMFAVRERLREADPAFGELLFGFGVVMPMETFTTQGAEIEPAVLLDRRDFRRNAGYYVGDLQRHWTEAYRRLYDRAPRMPSRADIKRARQILRPDVESAFSLGSYLNGVESRLIQLSNDQIRASRRMAANPRTIVRGKAGTGKTIIAVERAKQLAKEGNRVLFLCYNQLLAKHIRESLAAHPQHATIDVRHVHSLYQETISRAGMQGRLAEPQADGSDLFNKVYPAVFLEAFIEAGGEPYDALVVDEAQDLLTLENLDAFDVLLRYGLNRSRWHIFLDPLQNIYSRDLQDAVFHRLSEGQPSYDDLFENCRNSKQVASQASIISGIDLALEGAPDGPECDNVYYRSGSAFRELIEAEVRRLLKTDVNPRDIVILSTRRKENSLLARIDEIGGCRLAEAAAYVDDSILFSTMHAFKGLERKVVLAVDLDDIGGEETSMLHYAGLSRARVLLRCFLPETAKRAYGMQTARFIERNAPS